MICSVPFPVGKTFKFFQRLRSVCFLLAFYFCIASIAAALIIAVPCDMSLACSQPSPGPGSVRTIPQPEHHKRQPLVQNAGRWGSEGSLSGWKGPADSVTRESGRNQELQGSFDIYRTSDFDFNIFSKTWGFVMNLLRRMKWENCTAKKNDSYLFAEYFHITWRPMLHWIQIRTVFQCCGSEQWFLCFQGVCLSLDIYKGRFLCCELAELLINFQVSRVSRFTPLREPHPLSGEGMWFWSDKLLKKGGSKSLFKPVEQSGLDGDVRIWHEACWAVPCGCSCLTCGIASWQCR